MWEKWTYSCMFYSAHRGQHVGLFEDGICLEKCAYDSDCVTVAMTRQSGQKNYTCRVSTTYCDINKNDLWIPKSINDFIYVKVAPFCLDALNIDKSLNVYFEETSGLCYFILLKRKGRGLNRICSEFGTFVIRNVTATIESLTKGKIWLGIIVKKGKKLNWMDDNKWLSNNNILKINSVFNTNNSINFIDNFNNSNNKCFIYNRNNSIYSVDCDEIHDVVCVYPLLGGWSEWSSWLYFKKTRSRRKSCISPKPLINNIPSVLYQKYKDNIVPGCLSKIKENVERIHKIKNNMLAIESKDLKVKTSTKLRFDYEKSNTIPWKICLEIVDYSTEFEECRELCTMSSNCTGFVHSPNGKSSCAIDTINCENRRNIHNKVNLENAYLKSAVFCNTKETNVPQRWLYDHLSQTCFTIIGYTTANDAFHKCHQLKSHLLKIDYKNSITSSSSSAFQNNIFRFIKGEEIWLGLNYLKINKTYRWQSKFWPDYFTFNSSSVLQLSGSINDIFVQNIFVRKIFTFFCQRKYYSYAKSTTAKIIIFINGNLFLKIIHIVGFVK